MTFSPLIAGNWKMNGLAASLDEAKQLAAALAESPPACDVALCPPATLLAQMAWVLKGSAILIGAQDCHGKDSGAYTGGLSEWMEKKILRPYSLDKIQQNSKSLIRFLLISLNKKLAQLFFCFHLRLLI